MKFSTVVPQCRVNLDWGCALSCEEMNRQGVLNIPYKEGARNLSAALLGLMVDTITILDDGSRDIQACVRKALCVAPLADRVLILKKEGDGYRVFRKEHVVCADRCVGQRQVGVC